MVKWSCTVNLCVLQMIDFHALKLGVTKAELLWPETLRGHYITLSYAKMCRAFGPDSTTRNRNWNGPPGDLNPHPPELRYAFLKTPPGIPTAFSIRGGNAGEPHMMTCCVA